MTPDAFIAKWSGATLSERAAAQSHFLDLCHLLGEPTPAEADLRGEFYCFERGATKTTGGKGWADVWKRGCFGWEYKGKRRDLDAAYAQLQQYAPALENPPLLIVSDMETIILRPNWTNSVSRPIVLRIEELRDANRRAVLKRAFTDPDALRPEKTRQALTEEAAAEFAELARRLRARGHAAEDVARFVNRLVFCLFADDAALLPEGLWARMLDAAARAPARFQDFAERLFRAMRDPGGEVDFTAIAWFNGGLFDDAGALPLVAADIALLRRAAGMDWSEVDPSVLGTLFERGLDPDKRSQLGAHYTDRDKIALIVEPVVVRPLLAEWARARANIAANTARAANAKSPAARTRALAAARADYTGFLERLRAFRVLDPACGSGNFLYLALLALKDIEHRAGLEAEALGLQREFPGVGPEQLLGIEVNPYAAELARVSVWIGHIQWARRNGYEPPRDPVLRPLDTIQCRDAVLDGEGRAAEWPAADAIIGNPPFLGDKAMIGTLGEDYTRRLRAAYAGRVPGGADLVCYWFEKAREAIEAGRTGRAGLVATNSIRGGMNRRVLDRVCEEGAIFDAYGDEGWTLDGAAVRVSLVCFGKRVLETPFHLNARTVAAIYPDLTAGEANLLEARRLKENTSISFIGVQKTGAFDVSGEQAREWLEAPSNPNGLRNTGVVHPIQNALDVVRRPGDRWLVDFGATMGQVEASFYALPFAHVSHHVRPVRQQNRNPILRELWWRHEKPRQDMRAALRALSRYAATPRVAKHRLFVWLPVNTVPDCQLVVIARDDDTTFGILHSRFHEAWALRLCTWLGVGNDPRYTPTTTFETFPFPPSLTPNLPAAAYTDNPHAQAIAAAARALVEARDRWLNPPDLVERVPEVVPGFPDRILPVNAKAAAILKARTLTNLYNTRGKPEGAWLDGLHAALDAAVAAAYGWPAAIAEDEALAALLALNRQRAAGPGAPDTA